MRVTIDIDGDLVVARVETKNGRAVVVNADGNWHVHSEQFGADARADARRAIAAAVEALVDAGL